MIKAILVLAVLSYVYIRLITGIFVYQQDALKDQLASYLSTSQWANKRIILPFSTPESAEVGEALEFYTNTKRDPANRVELFNYWESPSALSDINRYASAAGVAPNKKQLSALLKDYPDEGGTIIWRYEGIYSSPRQGGNLQFQGWQYDVLNPGDIVILPLEFQLSSWIEARGIGMYFLGKNVKEVLQKKYVLDSIGTINQKIGSGSIAWQMMEIKKRSKYSDRPVH